MPHLPAAEQHDQPRGSAMTMDNHSDLVAKDATSELVTFLVHRAFYPVLMAERTGPNKAMIEHVQNATHKEIERFRSYGSAAELIANFERDLRSGSATSLYSDLKRLNLPVIGDVREEFERKARELGVMA